MPEKATLQSLLDTLPQEGRVDWIGIRPARGEPVRSIQKASIAPGVGIEGDRFKGRETSKRQVTLIQQEHLPVIAACAHLDRLDPAVVRRNIVVSGINLLALKGKTFRVGSALLEYTGLCHPCSKMEEFLGPGGYNAMRGHGGITARVLVPGEAKCGDRVFVEDPAKR